MVQRPKDYDYSTQCWRDIKYPDAMTSVFNLPNGTVAANFVTSGLQLLNLGGGYNGELNR